MAASTLPACGRPSTGRSKNTLSEKVCARAPFRCITAPEPIRRVRNSRLCMRSILLARHPFRYRLRLHEQHQVIRTAGLRVRARHVESAERVRAHHGARTLAVEIKIADEELLARLAEMFGIIRKYG